MLHKICRQCHEKKPESEFYIYSSTQKTMPICKVCHRAQNNIKRPAPKEVSGNRHESIAINHMRSMGIYAAPGKSSEYRRLDVIAWGCVCVEIKPALPMFDRTDVWHIHFTRKQHETRLIADVVIIMIPKKGGFGYYVMPAAHSFFRNRKGQILRDILFSRHIAQGSPLYEYQDNWQLIEDVRQSVITKLLNGDTGLQEIALPEQPQVEFNQLTLF
jgi:hypothetical protein